MCSEHPRCPCSKDLKQLPRLQSLDLSTVAEFEAQGVKARGILIEICGRLIQDGVILRYQVSQDWYGILSANERVRELVNHLTNMI